MPLSADAERIVSSSLLPRTRGQKRRVLAQSLRQMIAQMRASDRFPSVAELEKHYQVSTSTVEAAVRDLQTEGLIVRRRGSGTFVAETANSSKARPRTGHLVITTIGSGGSVNIFTAMAWALEAEMRRAGYDPILLLDNDPQTRLREVYKRWESGTVDGYVHIGSLDSRVTFPDIPGVVIGEVPANSPVHQVVVDNFGGGLRAGEYLRDLGHRHIGFVTVKSMISAGPRFDGLVKAFEGCNGYDSFNSASVNIQYLPVLPGEENLFATRIESVLENMLRDSTNTPTALFFANDQVAFPALQILLSWGIRVPQDISVISFDDTPGLASQTRPALTSLRMPTLGLGAQAVQALNDSVQHSGIPFRRLRLPAELIVRESSGPPRPADSFVSRFDRTGAVPRPLFPLEENP